MKRYSIFAVSLLLAGCATAHQESVQQPVQPVVQEPVVEEPAVSDAGSGHDQFALGTIHGGVLGGLVGAMLDKDRDDRIHASEARYHRSNCNKGDEYFASARQKSDLDERLTLMEKGISFCPKNPAAHNDLGLALLLWGDLNAARSHFNQALVLEPDYNPARVNLLRMQQPARKANQQAAKTQHPVVARDGKQPQPVASKGDEMRQSRDRVVKHEKNRKEYIEKKETWQERESRLREQNSHYY
ncbi:MAG: hypothetical protein CO187_02695 [Zetaproteobacteria bacterium CG_4_9_14_3_um_filter_53_7]|nr:MAG: hypothetical protein CO187_02695 [Zetaproteobacteria bacterium CG_4_9_14_3_um_filter_53_7]